MHNLKNNETGVAHKAPFMPSPAGPALFERGDFSTALYWTAWALTNPPIHMQATSIGSK